MIKGQKNIKLENFIKLRNIHGRYLGRYHKGYFISKLPIDYFLGHPAHSVNNSIGSVVNLGANGV